MGVEIVIFFAGGAFGHTAHVSRLDLAGAEETVASRAFLGGPAHAFDLFGWIGFLSVGGRVRFVVGETLFPKEEPMTTAAGILERTQHKIDSYPGNLGESYTRGSAHPL